MVEKLLISVLIGLLPIISIGCGDVSTKKLLSKPNVILISVDALRADHLSCYGYQRDTTPNIDRLASEGVLFSQAISQGIGTLESHMSMLTSLYPHTHGLNHARQTLDDSKVTLAEILKDNGYFTVAFTGGSYMDARYGFSQGFDIYDDSGGGIEKQIPRIFNALEKNRNKRFFIFIHTYDVHAPYNPPEPYDKLYTLPQSNFNPSVENLRAVIDKKATLTDDDLRRIIALYDGGIRYVDEHIGRLLKKLDELGLSDKTLIIITADHGEEFMEHGSLMHEWQLYDELIHVPFIMRFKEKIGKGQIIRNQVQSIDIMPTVLDILGISLNKEAEGTNLVPLINGVESINRAAYTECLGWPGFGINLYSIRTERFKFIYTISKAKGPSVELYNLKNDPGETMNLAFKKPQLAEKLKKHLFDHIGSAEELFREGNGQIDEELRKRLKSLGYLQ